MKTCFVVASKYLPEVEKTQPLGPMYIASYLRDRRGDDVSIVDMKVHGLRPDEAVDRVLANRPDVVGLSSITLDSAVMSEVAAGVRRRLPNATIVAGGPHPTAYWDEVLDDPNFDYVVLGEGEPTLEELFGVLEAGGDPASIPGLAFRRDGGKVNTGPRPFIDGLDDLPFPAWDLIPVKDYWDVPRVAFIYAEREYMTITSSRGCPFKCAYCHKTLGRKWRARSPENVVDEIEVLLADWGIREIVFVDDMVNLDVERLESIAREILNRGLTPKLSFPVGFRADILKPETVKLLKKAGMYRCMVAIETASPRLQKLIRKNLNLAKVEEAIRFIAANDILVHGVFMLGFPTETEQELDDTVNFALRSKLHTAAFARVLPFKDSDLIDLARQDGVEVTPDYEQFLFTFTQSNLSHVPNKVIRRKRRSVLRRFYLNPVRLWRFFRLLPNRGRFVGLLMRLFLKRAFFLP